jgi:transcriptional regulator with XRE-family HTH domain
MLQITENIRLARKAANISQEKMAFKLEVKRSTYANWESKIVPDLEMIKKISIVLGISFEKLIDNEPKIIECGNVINEPDIPLLKDKNIDDRIRNEKSLHVMIENSLELNIAHKNVTATNLKLTAMLETLIMGNSNSGSLPNISPILAPYLDLIAAGGVGKFWKDKSAGKVELGKILNAQKEKNSELHMK